jgi:hypothetical protein
MDGGRLPGVLALRRVGAVRAGGRRKASARGWAALPVGLRLDPFISSKEPRSPRRRLDPFST